jgi:serine/threonine protein phosphatase PrpC
MGVVADGMGGRTGGRKASEQVLMTARQLFERFSPGREDAGALLLQIGREAHMVIRMTAITAEQEPHSTMVAFIISPNGACHWAHTGDSRLYHFRGTALVQRTKDQSYVQALVDRGELTEEQAAVHPKSNVLLHCLGTEENPELEAHYVPRLETGDTLLACTDGLWPYFTPEEMGAVLEALPPREASQFLIEKARARAAGGGDNLSLAIVKVEPLTPDKPAVGSAFSALN